LNRGIKSDENIIFKQEEKKEEFKFRDYTFFTLFKGSIDLENCHHCVTYFQLKAAA